MHEGNITQQRANEDESRAPDQGTQGVEDQELNVGVACHSCRERNEGTNEGDETTNDQRTPAVVTEVSLGLFQVLGLQDSSIRLEELASPLCTEEVTDLCADEGRNNNHDDQCRQV